MVRRVPAAKVIAHQVTTLLLAVIVLLSVPSESRAATHYVVANAKGASDANDGVAASSLNAAPQPIPELDQKLPARKENDRRK